MIKKPNTMLNRKSNIMKLEKALLGVLIGVAAGAALGLLFAPYRGSETRKKLLSKGGDLANSLNDRVVDKFNELLSAIIAKSERTARQSDYKEKKGELMS